MPNSHAMPLSHSSSPIAELPARLSSVGIIQVRQKQTWVAVLLALISGPIGLYYCTVPGAIIMFVVSIALEWWLREASLFIVLPACAVLAWKVTREW